MAKRVQSVTGCAVTKAVAATLPAPVNVGDGVSTTTSKLSWKSASGAGYSLGLVTVFADGSATLSSPELWGREPTHNRWGFIAQLNNGTALTLSATRSFYQQIDLPTVFDELAVVGTVGGGGGNVGYTLMPLAEVE